MNWPAVMNKVLMVTRRPLRWGGEVSAIYTGTVMDAIPEWVDIQQSNNSNFPFGLASFLNAAHIPQVLSKNIRVQYLVLSDFWDKGLDKQQQL